jgi:hypothetical protein
MIGSTVAASADVVRRSIVGLSAIYFYLGEMWFGFVIIF